MEIKTYTRARAAKAKARDIVVGMHEFPEGIYAIETPELAEGRFTAKVVVDFAALRAIAIAAADAIDLLREDLIGAGLVFEVINQEGNAKESEEVRAAEVAAGEDVSKTAAEVLDEEIAEIRAEKTLANDPLPGKASYVNEASTFGGVVSYCREVIPQLAAKGMTRKAVIEELRNRGVAYGTARTQYQQWFASRKA